MKKITKLLSVFVIAGALAGTAGALTGCKHKHSFDESKWETSETQHWHSATCEHTDEKGSLGDHVDAKLEDGTDGNDYKCDVCGYDMATHVDGLTLDKTIMNVAIGQTGTITANVSPEDASVKTVNWQSSDTTVATVANGVVTGVKEGIVTITATTEDGAKVATCKVAVAEEGTTLIYDADTFNAFRTSKELSGTYKLYNDLDLTGCALEATSAVISEGVTFDGQGYIISNASYTDAAEKTGILAAQLTGGKVTNVKFLNCSANVAGESTAIVVGLCEGGEVSKVEFNSCSVKATGNYAGLVFARNTKAGTIKIAEITVKNGTSTSCAQYGGLLTGDMVSGTLVSFSNLDLDGAFKDSSGNGSFIAGRTRAGSSISVKNAVISAEMPVANSIGIFSGNGSLTSLKIENVLIVKSNVSALYQSNKAPAEETITGLYAVAGVTVDKADATTVGENTPTFLAAHGFDFTADTGVWLTEGENDAKYRLRAASTNVKSADATISSLKVSTANVKLRFKEGETFTAEGLSVMGAYSDGVQLVLKEGVDFEIVSTEFASTQGEYTIKIKSLEDATKTASYKVNVVKQTGIKVYDEFMKKVYRVGSTALDLDNLVVVSVWSDGVEEKLAKADYDTSGTIDFNTVDGYELQVTSDTFTAAETLKVSVVSSRPVVVDGKIYVSVDANSAAENGSLVKGIETFKTVADAIDFLEDCNYENEVQKVVYIAAGTYKAKITTALDNLVLVGADKATTVLTYSAVESTVSKVSGKAYGLDCATLKVSGEGFKAYNLSIRNDFDYINDAAKESSPQGLALTIDGDKAVINNCHLYGNQDTLYLRNGRAYFKNTQIDGNIDFIFGETTGLAFFDNCTIKAITKFADDLPDSKKNNNGYVTAMKGEDGKKPDYGYIFSGCTFTSDDKVLAGSMSLGRPWGPKATVAYINCSFTEAYSTVAYDGSAKSRWYEMSGNLPQNADFCEYGSTGAGAITSEVTGGKILTEAQAANYTKANIFAATNGQCTWSAAWDCDADLTALTAITAPTSENNQLVQTSEALTIKVDESADLPVHVGPWNAVDKEVTYTVADETVATCENGIVKGLKVGTTTITVTYKTETKNVTVTVEAKAAPTQVENHFSYTELKATLSDGGTADKQALTQANFTGANAFIKVLNTSGMQYRSSNDCFEIKDNALAVTFTGTGTISISLSSTGGSNKSRIGLRKGEGASGAYVAATTSTGFTAVTDGDAGAYEMTGTTVVTITFTVTEPGTYTITCPSSVTNRGARIMNIDMVDNL